CDAEDLSDLPMSNHCLLAGRTAVPNILYPPSSATLPRRSRPISGVSHGQPGRFIWPKSQGNSRSLTLTVTRMPYAYASFPERLRYTRGTVTEKLRLIRGTPVRQRSASCCWFCPDCKRENGIPSRARAAA